MQNINEETQKERSQRGAKMIQTTHNISKIRQIMCVKRYKQTAKTR